MPGIVLGSLLSILKDLNKHCITAKLMPHMLSEAQENCLMCQDLQQRLDCHPTPSLLIKFSAK
jgi:hypothetical protein